MTLRITELLGDGIGPELRESVHAVAAELPEPIEFVPVDLSVERRRRDSSERSTGANSIGSGSAAATA